MMQNSTGSTVPHHQPLNMGYPEVGKNSSSPVVLQPLIPQQSGGPMQYASGPVPVSNAQRAPLNAVDFSYNRNSQLGQKEESSGPNAPSNAPNDTATVPSSGPSIIHTTPTTASTVFTTSTFTQTTTSTAAASPFAPPPSLPGPPTTPPPQMAGLRPSLPPNPTFSSTTTHFLPPAVMRPFLPVASVPSNPGVQQQAYPPPYPMVPSSNAPPHPLWLPNPQMGGPRPPFLPYPPLYPGPFGVAARGMSLPSVPLPEAQPPGVTPVVNPPSAVTSIPLTQSSGMQLEVPPPGTDDSRKIGDAGRKDDIVQNEDAWSAHRTEAGVVYYYNAITGESTYVKPSGFKGEPAKAIAQPTPVSWEKLAGTDWSLVTTNDGKRYYYNAKTEVSSWQVPSEVAELRKKQESDTSKENLTSVPKPDVLNEKGSGTISLSASALNTGGRDSIALRTSGTPGSSSALDLIKRKLTDYGAQVTSISTHASSGSVLLETNGSKTAEATTVKGLQSEGGNDNKLKDEGLGNISDSSSDSEEDSKPTKEERVAQFKEMLKERGVAPFSKWDKELPKIVFDPRFKEIPTYAERRSLFEHYVRTRAEEERREKRAAFKAAIEGFKHLLDEATEDIDQNTDYHTFKKKWGHDARFRALEHKERETLLNERILSRKRAAQEKAQAEHAAVAASFKAMLRERVDINSSSRWSRVKDGIRDDNRYKAVKHEDREPLFNEYISELKYADDEVSRAAKAKRDEQEKLKEREREMRKRKERDEQEMERIRLKVRRKEVVASYQALLVETIKDPQASWTESKPKLEKDPQGRASNPDLDEADLEKLFREHVKMLYERCMNDFRALLTEVITSEAALKETEDGKTVVNSWSTAKKLLKSDIRYSKMPRKDRESLWKRHADELKRKQKGDMHNESKNRSSVDRSRVSSSLRGAQERRYVV